jgi:hypothetical protein
MYARARENSDFLGYITAIFTDLTSQDDSVLILTPNDLYSADIPDLFRHIDAIFLL